MTIAAFEEEAQEIHRKMEELPPVIYHYRKWKRLEGILTEKELRLACFKGLQETTDKEELKFGHETILSCIAQRRLGERLLPEVFPDSLHPNEVLKSLQQGNSKLPLPSDPNYIFWQDYHEVFEDVLNHMSVYVGSFSHAKDDEELWKRYAPEGDGVSIGFQMKPGEIVPDDNLNPLYPIKVFYEDDIEEFKKRINQFLDLAEKHLPKIPESEYANFSATLSNSLLAYIPCLKKNEFNFEKEYRIVMTGIIGADGKRYPYEIDKKNELANFLDPKTGKTHKEYHFLYDFPQEWLQEIILLSTDKEFEEQAHSWLQENGYKECVKTTPSKFN